MYFRNFAKQLRQLQRNSRLSRAELERQKERQFRQLVRYAAEHSAYYRDLIQQQGIDVETCRVSDFPILTKDQVITEFDRLVTDPSLNRQRVAEFLEHSKDPNDLLFDKYQVVHTSGSSGQVGCFVFTVPEWCVGMAQSGRFLYPAKQPRFPWMRRIRYAFVGAIGGHFAGVSFTCLITHRVLNWRYKLKLLEVNQPLDQVVAALNEFKPDLVAGYTTALCQLAEEQEAGRLKLNTKAISTSGEPQTKVHYEKLSRTFQCPVMNTYACSENLLMGHSIDENNSMIIYDDHFIVEFAEQGIVVTNLFNFTQPLIRYQMSDVLRPLDSNAVSPYLLVESVVGRNEVNPVFLNRNGVEDYLSPHNIVELFMPGVSRFQMHLLGDNAFEFRICLDGSVAETTAREEMGKKLYELLAQKNMENVQFQVVVVDDLKLDAETGKFKLIVDRRQAVVVE